MTPDIPNDHARFNGRFHGGPTSYNKQRRNTNDNDKYGSSFRSQEIFVKEDHLPAKRERSLSPFSKRLALTQAMNVSR